MRMLALSLMAAFALGFAGLAYADDGSPKTVDTGANLGTAHADGSVTGSMRASKLIGTDVKNGAGEDLGEIEDLVIDLRNGRVRYAAVSFGGFLGLGDKLFAVPYNSLKLVENNGSQHYVLNVEKARLKNAPGFDKDKWPTAAGSWDEVDKFYGPGVQVDIQR
jgi:sporulation protein YlmC with PRC-barrel domain